mgnify:CR=1 FL=1
MYNVRSFRNVYRNRRIQSEHSVGEGIPSWVYTLSPSPESSNFFVHCVHTFIILLPADSTVRKILPPGDLARRLFQRHSDTGRMMHDRYDQYAHTDMIRPKDGADYGTSDAGDTDNPDTSAESERASKDRIPIPFL